MSRHSLRIVDCTPATAVYLGVTVVADADTRPCPWQLTCPDFSDPESREHWHVTFTASREDGTAVRGARTLIIPPTDATLRVLARRQSSLLTRLRRS